MHALEYKTRVKINILVRNVTWSMTYGVINILLVSDKYVDCVHKRNVLYRDAVKSLKIDHTEDICVENKKLIY